MKVYKVTLPDEVLPSKKKLAFEYGNRVARFDRPEGQVSRELSMHENEARAFASRGLVVEEVKWTMKTSPADYIKQHEGDEAPSDQVRANLELARAIESEKE